MVTRSKNGIFKPRCRLPSHLQSRRKSCNSSSYSCSCCSTWVASSSVGCKERILKWYYYAVVECDSATTADCLYKTCDGVEFERSANKLDLRFIPDSMEFKHQPHDVATEMADLELKEYEASDESESDGDNNEDEEMEDKSEKKV